MATVREAEGTALDGLTVEFFAQVKLKGKTVWTRIGTAATDVAGSASQTIPSKYVSTTRGPIRADFGGDASFMSSSDGAVAYRN